MKINDRIEMITNSSVNCYLVKGRKESVLIDTGYYKDRKKLADYLKDKNVKIILLTHGHIDHIGGAKYIADKYNAKIMMNVADKEILTNNDIRNVYSDSLLGSVIRRVSVRNFRRSHYDDIKIDSNISDGQIIELGDISIKAAQLSGHTKGSYGFIFSDCFFVGDALMNMMKPSLSLIYENKNEMLNSAKIIKEKKLDNILPGHGKPFNIAKIRCEGFTI